MRRRGLPRCIALTAAVAGVLAGAAAGCGREGDLVAPRATQPPSTATTRTGPPTGTTPLPATTTQPRTVTTPPPPTATTARPKPATTTTTQPKTVTTPPPPPPPPPAAPGAAPTALQLRTTAADYARRTFRITVTPQDVTLRRSRRKPRWAIASGEEGRALWVVWMRDGKIVLMATDPAKFDPPAVPCDIRPAFSEPGC